MVAGNYRKFHCPARKAPLGDSHVGQSQCDRPLPLYGILSLHNVIGPYDFHIVLTVCGFPCRISENSSLTPISCSEYDSRYTFYWIVLLLICTLLKKVQYLCSKDQDGGGGSDTLGAGCQVLMVCGREGRSHRSKLYFYLFSPPTILYGF